MRDDRLRTFSYRALVIGIASMIALAMWVQFHEVLAPNPGPLAENSPPAGAVGIFIGVILIGSAVAWLSRVLGRSGRLRLTPGELIVIYCMLVTSAPLMSQGMWHRFLGLVVAIPHNDNNLALVDSFSDKLWPHGPHLIDDRRFGKGLGPDVVAEPVERVRVVRVDNSQVGPVTAVELINSASSAAPSASPSGTETPSQELARHATVTVLRMRVPRRRDGKEQLVPGERYYINALFRVSDMLSRSSLTLELVSDGGDTEDIVGLRRDTKAAYSSPGAFVRKGRPYVSIPRDVREYVDLVFTLQGVGRALITDVVFFSNEAVWRLHKGSTEVRAADLPRVRENSRDSLVVRPDNLSSPAGVWYVMKGYVPYRQWVRPLLYWLSIVVAIFLCLLGIGIIFRKQWAENERFSFPMVVLPRLILEQKDEEGKLIRPLFRKATFRIGVGVALVFCLMQGLAHYIPGMPDPTVNVYLGQYFSSPAVKAFVNGMIPADRFWITLLFTSIAFFVDLDMLRSILVFFWLAKAPYFFGEVLGWKNIKGPRDNFPFPYEQHMGAFLGLSLIVLWISRKHLLGVGRRILGLTGGIDDKGEAMSYRAAAVLICGAFVFFAIWGTMTGLGAGSALLFFGFLVVCGLSASRIRTECGAPFTYFTPYYPYLIFFLLGGLQIFGSKTMVLAYCAGGFMAVAQFLLFAPTQVEMMHLGTLYKARLRGVSWALVLGCLGGVLLGGYVMLVWAYGVGGENISYMKTWALQQNWYLSSLRAAVATADSEALVAAAQGTEVQAQYPAGPLTAVGIGTGITVLLFVLRTQFVGFWLHPISYVLANTHFVYGCWGSILVAWIVKSLALRIGGPRLIREQLTPLFAGVFCGCVLGMALWDVIALIALGLGTGDVFTCWP